ncbi:hypothetical protein H6764_03270 [Candidatus Nomurabacteria bacterium]|nr:hypothetical protein [Candidatus Nomurabacteria bacterium]
MAFTSEISRLSSSASVAFHRWRAGCAASERKTNPSYTGYFTENSISRIIYNEDPIIDWAFQTLLGDDESVLRSFLSGQISEPFIDELIDDPILFFAKAIEEMCWYGWNTWKCGFGSRENANTLWENARTLFQNIRIKIDEYYQEDPDKKILALGHYFGSVRRCVGEHRFRFLCGANL